MRRNLGQEIHREFRFIAHREERKKISPRENVLQRGEPVYRLACPDIFSEIWRESAEAIYMLKSILVFLGERRVHLSVASVRYTNIPKSENVNSIYLLVKLSWIMP